MNHSSGNYLELHRLKRSCKSRRGQAARGRRKDAGLTRRRRSSSRRAACANTARSAQRGRRQKGDEAKARVQRPTQQGNALELAKHMTNCIEENMRTRYGGTKDDDEKDELWESTSA